MHIFLIFSLFINMSLADSSKYLNSIYIVFGIECPGIGSISEIIFLVNSDFMKALFDAEFPTKTADTRLMIKNMSITIWAYRASQCDAFIAARNSRITVSLMSNQLLLNLETF